MKELPKFIVAQNVLADPEGIYIIHTQKPAFVAKAFPKTGEIEPVDKLAEKYPAGARTNRINGTYYIIAVIRFFEQADPNGLEKIMSRMGDWFFNYVKNI